MIRRQFYHEMFRFDIDLIQIEDNTKDLKQVLKVCKEHNLDLEEFEELTEKLRRPTVCDGGYTFWNANVHGIFVVFFPITCLDEAVVIYDHEKRHCEDRMLQFCGVHDAETSAYLAGQLGLQFRQLQDAYFDRKPIK